MVVSASGADRVAEHTKACSKRLGIEDYLLCVLLERRLECFMKADSLGRDDLHERPSLNAGEDLSINLLGILFLAEDEAGTGSTETLMRGCRDKVGDRNGILMDTTCNEACDVRHINEEVGSDGVGNLTESHKVDLARVGGSAGREHLRANFLGLLGKGIIVDTAIVLRDAVVGDLVELAGEVGLVSVGEVTTMRQIHGEDFIAGLEDAEVDGHVGLATAVGLNVGMLGSEKLLGTFDRESLDDIDMLTPAIPAASWITLGVLVGEAGALGLHDGLAGEVLRGDELDVLELAMMFGRDGGRDLRIGLREGAGGVE